MYRPGIIQTNQTNRHAKTLKTGENHRREPPESRKRRTRTPKKHETEARAAKREKHPFIDKQSQIAERKSETAKRKTADTIKITGYELFSLLHGGFKAKTSDIQTKTMRTWILGAALIGASSVEAFAPSSFSKLPTRSAGIQACSSGLRSGARAPMALKMQEEEISLEEYEALLAAAEANRAAEVALTPPMSNGTCICAKLLPHP